MDWNRHVNPFAHLIAVLLVCAATHASAQLPPQTGDTIADLRATFDVIAEEVNSGENFDGVTNPQEFIDSIVDLAVEAFEESPREAALECMRFERNFSGPEGILALTLAKWTFERLPVDLAVDTYLGLQNYSRDHRFRSRIREILMEIVVDSGHSFTEFFRDRYHSASDSDRQFMLAFVSSTRFDEAIEIAGLASEDADKQAAAHIARIRETLVEYPYFRNLPHEIARELANGPFMELALHSDWRYRIFTANVISRDQYFRQELLVDQLLADELHLVRWPIENLSKKTLYANLVFPEARTPIERGDQDKAIVEHQRVMQGKAESLLNEVRARVTLDPDFAPTPRR